MCRFWSPVVHQLTPHTPGEQPRSPGILKLNTNENPYPPSPTVHRALSEAIADSLRLYPDPDSSELKLALAASVGLTAQHVFVGNGSDEVLAHTFHGLMSHGKPLLMPDVSYGFYPAYCRLYGVPFKLIPLADNLTLRVDDYLTAVRQPYGGVLIANPNAPTGRLIQLSEIERLVEGCRESVVVIDEAYIDFGGDSAVSLVPRFENLLVVQTFSKARSLAGLRVGYAFGHPTLVEGLERVKSSFNSYPLDRIAQAGAAAALADVEYFHRTRDAVVRSRESLSLALESLGFEVQPSMANFVFVRHPRKSAQQLMSTLRSDGILVRHFNSPRTAEFIRITVGTPEQCARLIDSLIGRP
ncbi:histidinol-phosphate transaminase [Rhizobacter sp. Root404]|uniref:histidinol-phosphate transaminase n=1 Tax=Rhizobacter sp. Root404 TaxID=1736528 RepID=UPI0006F77462|nr:histidinol-phosphate transaminase [Rhizobacter sp. Root404]KQW38412.1 histidinol-phosphate aminotransferase [Rhizobacter sp. Root404]